MSSFFILAYRYIGIRVCCQHLNLTLIGPPLRTAGSIYISLPYRLCSRPAVPFSAKPVPKLYFVRPRIVLV
jgi:hypothetical protein